jgi:hypothetical protein
VGQWVIIGIGKGVYFGVPNAGEAVAGGLEDAVDVELGPVKRSPSDSIALLGDR